MYVLQIDLGRETFIWCGAKAHNIFWVVVEKVSEQGVLLIRSLLKGDLLVESSQCGVWSRRSSEVAKSQDIL